jgi:hypothetical protein
LNAAPVDEAGIRGLARQLGRVSRIRVRIYLTGGATGVLEGWRESTIDVDLRFEPKSDELLREIPALKESLGVNVELASPPDFIPELPSNPTGSRSSSTQSSPSCSVIPRSTRRRSGSSSTRRSRPDSRCDSRMEVFVGIHCSAVCVIAQILLRSSAHTRYLCDRADYLTLVARALLSA